MPPKTFKKKKVNYLKKPFNILNKKPSKRLVNTIKKVISRQIENKIQDYGPAGLVDLASASNTAVFPGNNVKQLTPFTGELVIQQGTGQGARIGNDVRVVKATLALQYFPQPYSGSTNSIPMPQVVRIIIFSLKTPTDTIANAQSVCLNTFFQNGSSYSGFVGNMTDYLRSVNRDQVTVYKDITIKLGAALYASNTGTQAQFYQYANNDFPLNQHMKIDLLKCGYPKVLRWNDNDVITSGRQLYIVSNPMDADGGTNTDTTSALPSLMDYHINIEYEDA